MNLLRLLRSERHRISPGAALAVLMVTAGAVRAGLPEPDTVFYGAIAIDGTFATASSTQVTVELRQTEDGPAVSSYRMGDSAAAGDRYVLRARVESSAPVSDPDATALGGTVYLVVKQGGVVRATRSQVISERGRFVNLNFGDADSDGDGMSDAFELANFGSDTGGDPNADPDLDGRPNRREFLQGTNPNVADGRHPADVSPADDRLNIQEVTEYALAWKLGEPWSVEPLTIPADFVTRASALWVGGERYLFDNDPVTTAPLWWVNDPSALPPTDAGPAPASTPVQNRLVDVASGTEAETERTAFLAGARAALSASAGRVSRQGITATGVTRDLPWNYQLHQPFRVTLNVKPEAGTRAFAVEESAPAGWLIRFVSEGGRYDSRNRRVKWGPFFGSASRTLTYEVTPLDATGSGQFSGAGSFDGSSRTTVGRSAVYAPGVVPEARLDVAREGDITRLHLNGAPGQSYTLESSADLLEWTAHDPVTTDASGGASVELSGETHLRFFRLRP